MPSQWWFIFPTRPYHWSQVNTHGVFLYCCGGVSCQVCTQRLEECQCSLAGRVGGLKKHCRMVWYVHYQYLISSDLWKKDKMFKRNMIEHVYPTVWCDMLLIVFCIHLWHSCSVEARLCSTESWMPNCAIWALRSAVTQSQYRLWQ